MIRTCKLLVLVLLAATATLAQEAPAKTKAKSKAATVSGRIGAIDATKKALTVAAKAGNVTILTDGKTEIFINDDKAEFGALKVDMKVRVAGVKQGDEVLARRIIDDKTIALYEQESDGVAAVIESLPAGRSGLVVTTEQGKRRELAIGATSSIMKDGQNAAADTFKPGDKVYVAVRRAKEGLVLRGLADPATFMAFLVPRTMRGKVKSVDGKTLVVVAAGDKETTRVKLTRNTKFYSGGKAEAASPFKADDEVVVKYAQKTKGTITAKVVFAPDSWKAYGEAALAEKSKPKG